MINQTGRREKLRIQERKGSERKEMSSVWDKLSLSCQQQKVNQTGMEQ
jgi:hypothetical protein